MTLLNRLLLLVVAPFVLCASLALFFLGHWLEAKLRQEVLEVAHYSIVLRAQALENHLAARHGLLRVLLYGKTAVLPASLPEWKRFFPRAENLIFLSLDGLIHLNQKQNVTLPANHPWQAAIRRGEPALSDLTNCPVSGNPVILLSEPVFNPQGQLVGALAITWTQKRLHDLIYELNPKNEGTAILLDGQGQLLAGHLPSALLASPQPDLDDTLRHLRSNPAVSSKGMSTVEYTGHDQLRWQVLLQPVASKQWSIGLVFPQEKLFSALDNVWRTGGLFIALMALLSSLALLVFHRTLLQPIQRLLSAQKELEEGHLSTRVASGNHDELGQLSRSFNHMAERLEIALRTAQSSEKMVRSLFEGADDAICLMDGERFVDVNPYGEQLFRATRAQLLQSSPIALSPERQADGRTSVEAGQEFIRLAYAGQAQHFAWKHQAFDGTLVDCDVHLNWIEIDDRVYLQAIIRDVTQNLQREASAHAMEEKFTRVFEACPDSIAIARLDDGKIIDCNAGFERISGYSRQEVVGKTFHELELWANPECRKSLVERMIAEGVVQNFHFLVRRRDGTLLDVVASTGTFFLDGVSHYVAFVRDVSEEVATQRALAASEARLKTIFDAAPIPIAINRLADFTYISANPAHERLFGISSADLQGRSVREAGLIHLGDGRVAEQTRRLLLTGKLDHEEAVAHDTSGRMIHFVYSSRLIELEGESVILTISTDISPLKLVEEGLRRTEEALRESEQRFFALFQSSPSALAVFHRGKYGYTALQLNQVWFDTFLYPEEEVIGRETRDFGFWQDNQDRDRMIEQIEMHGELSNFEAWINRHDGKPLLCSLSARTISVGSERMLLVAYADITQQREFESTLHDFNITLELRIQERTRELQQAQESLVHSERLAALGSLVAGVAHELSTPIGNTLVVATTLAEQTETLRGQLSSGMKRSALENYLKDSATGLAIVERNLQRASELIHNFRSVAVDQTSTQRRQFELGQIIEEILGAMRPALKKKPYLLRTEVAPKLEMDSFPGPLEQVLVNLINNAILHGFDERSEGSILISAQPLGEDRVLLSVSDDGHGVDSASLRRIFDPFFTTKLGKGGSGLGLHIVRNIVEDVLGGRITAESEPGQGLRMCIDIPRHAPELAQEHPNGVEAA